ncbi:MAG: hypothetical protein J6M60_01775 [Clostridia bacterium]|nr:hypothetical protein [Clostridia bacterium]
MESIIRNYQYFSIVFTFILGTLLHFTYKLSNENKIVALFSSINESTWEHLKLLFYPMLLTIIIGYFYIGKDVPNFICAKTIGIIISMLFTVIFFYTYTGILGKNIAIIDIISFYIVTIIGECVAYKLLINGFECNNIISIVVLTIFVICFTVFTFYTPKIGLFKDPITGKYGLIKN